ncbi:MAG: DUF6263 family protein [Pirellulales bacterium]|nr:DUF6263 family protein [Pirellulales bacterium]
MSRCLCLSLTLSCLCLLLLDSRAIADDAVLLKYKFANGEKLRWQVSEQVVVKTTMRGTTQVAKTSGTSIKQWDIKSLGQEGSVTFEHMVESVNMKMWLTGRDEISYNSKTDAKPPEQYKGVAENVGRPLSQVTMDAHGKVVERKSIVDTPQIASRQIAMPLPSKPVKVGESWTRPFDISVKLRSGATKSIKARQKFTLLAVKDDVAQIKLDTQILTPVTDAEIESQIIQRKTSGTANFDIAKGRFTKIELSLDDSVHQFRGPDSVMHYKMKFVEQLLSAS